MLGEEGFLKYSFLGPIHRVSNAGDPDGIPRSAFLTRSQVMLQVLVRDYVLRTTKLSRSYLSQYSLQMCFCNP